MVIEKRRLCILPQHPRTQGTIRSWKRLVQHTIGRERFAICSPFQNSLEEDSFPSPTNPKRRGSRGVPSSLTSLNQPLLPPFGVTEIDQPYQEPNQTLLSGPRHIRSMDVFILPCSRLQIEEWRIVLIRSI